MGTLTISIYYHVVVISQLFTKRFTFISYSAKVPLTVAFLLFCQITLIHGFISRILLLKLFWRTEPCCSNWSLPEVRVLEDLFWKSGGTVHWLSETKDSLVTTTEFQCTETNSMLYTMENVTNLLAYENELHRNFHWNYFFLDC